MHIPLESPDQPEVISLVAELDAYQDTLHPPESGHSLDLTSLKQPNIEFVVARNSSRQAIGSGAVRLVLPGLADIRYQARILGPTSAATLGNLRVGPCLLESFGNRLHCRQSS